jgi:alpha/beta superfamily hydrolase
MLPRLLLATVLLAAASARAAEPAARPAPPATAVFSADRLALIDRPFQGENITLSPDAKHLAFTKYEDDKLWLVVTDFAAKTQKVVVLQDDSDQKQVHPRLAVLRWASARWLVLAGLDGEIMSLDIAAQKPVALWQKGDDGLADDTYLRKEPFNIVAGVPRLLPGLPDDPDHVMIESVAELGAERLVNVFRVSLATGDDAVPDPTWYQSWQVALYGRGDMLIWAPLPYDVERWIRNPVVPNGTIGNLRNVQRYFDSSVPGGDMSSLAAPPYQTRSKLEMFLAFPPEQTDTGVDLHGWPAAPITVAVVPGASAPPPPPPPTSISLIPSTGGAVTADSSSTGRMIYDRQGRPRLLYTQDTAGGARKWLLFETGQPIFDPNIPPRDLDFKLGQPKRHEFEINPGNFFEERSYPLAFDYDPDVLYYASNVGRDTFGIYSLNLKTKERQTVAAPESLPFDLAPLEPDYDASHLVFDDQARRLVGIRFNSLHPSTLWLDPELASTQQVVSDSFRQHNIEILNWSDDRQHFLLRMSSAEDPGAYLIFHRADNSVDVALRRAPWLKDTTIHASTAIAFQTPAGTKLTGWMTLPTTPKLTPPPLLIYCQGGLWDGDAPGFSREAQILADLGVAVMRVNYRGSAGHGRAHLTALLQGIDSVPLDDILASIDWISARYKTDRARTVIMGEGFGGYLALRALQLHTDLFRCAISLNAPTNLTAWASWKPMTIPHALYRSGDAESTSTIDFTSLVRGALVKNAKKAPNPPVAKVDNKALLVIESTGNEDTTPFSSLFASLGLGAKGATVEHLGLDGPFVGGSLATRTKVFTRIEEFLNFNLYDFGSSIGELKVLEDKPAPAKK